MCRSVSALSDTRWHTRLMRYVFGQRARALCSRGKGVRSLWAFLGGKAPLLFVPFLERIGAIICPPRLGSSHSLGSEETWWRQMELADEIERGIKISRSSASDESKLLEEDVLCLTSSDPAGSALLLFLSFLSLSAPRMKSCWKLWSMLLLG